MTETFHVRIGHVAPGAPTVDVLVDGYPVLADRRFGDVNEYTEHEAAEYDVAVRPADGGDVLVETPVVFEAGRYYTLLLLGAGADLECRVLVDGPDGAE